MRKLKKLLVLLVMFTGLSACTKSEKTPASDFGADAVPISVKWETDKGIYFTSTPLFLAGIVPTPDFGPADYNRFEGDPLLLYITDAATGNDIILCNRPDCPHDGEDCNAYLPYDEYYDASRSRDIRKTSVIFVDGEFVYAHNAASRIFRFHLDGTGRTEAVILPDRYQGISGWLMNGKLYAQSHSLKMGEEGIYTSIAKVLLEIDYVSGNVREIWEENRKQDVNSRSDIFAVSGGIFYGIEIIYDNTEYLLFSIDPGDDDAQANIIHRGKEDAFHPCLAVYTLENPGVYYHSRQAEAVYWLDTVTGESVEIAGNLPGTIKIIGLFGGRLFWVDFMKDNEAGYRVTEDITGGMSYTDEDEVKLYEALFFVDIETGEISASSIITKRTLFDAITLEPGGYSGNADGFANIIYEDGGYFYIEIERQEKEADVWGNGSAIQIYLHRHLIGRIPIGDYWSGNSGAIEELGWVDAQEFLKMRAGGR